MSETAIFSLPDAAEIAAARRAAHRPSPGLAGLDKHSTRWNMRAALIDGSAFALMVGLGENAIPPFVLAMHPQAAVETGLVLSIPYLAGAVGQFFSPALVRRLRSHRAAVVLYSALQGLSFFLLCGAALWGLAPIWLIFAFASLYWGSGLAAGAAWSTWMPANIPRRIRARYFGRRTRAIQGCVVVGLVLGGISLKLAKDTNYLFHTFAALFLAAGVCRWISALYLTMQAEPDPLPADHRHVRAVELARSLHHSPGARLLLYMLSMQFTVCIALHFFIPYTLDVLQVNYLQYQLLVAAPFLARMASLSFFGHAAHRHGARAVLWLGGAGLIPLSAVWMVSGNFFYLLGIQLVAGVIWAAYELSTFLLILETIPESERTSVMTTFYLANAVAMVAGACLGGWILSHYGKTGSAYMTVFAVSFGARFVSLFFLMRLGPRSPAPPG